MQLLGHQPANGGFARAHETNERDVDDASVVLHRKKVAQTSSL
jgi:hypothetical protein